MERISTKIEHSWRAPAATELWFWRAAALAGLCFTLYYGLIRQLERGVWHDEALTTFFISLDWGELFSLMAQYEANMGLYYVLLKIWSTVSMSELWLRLFSLSAHFATGATLYIGAKRYLGVRSAYFFLTLFLSHYLLVRYSVEIRGYALAAFLVALLWTVSMRLATEKQLFWWPSYAVIGAMAIYSHLLVSIAVLFSGLFVLLTITNLQDLKRWIVCHLFIVASFIPLLNFALTKENGQLEWIAAPTLKTLIYSLFDVSGAYGYAGRFVRYFNFILVFSILPLLILFNTYSCYRKTLGLKANAFSKPYYLAVLSGFGLPLAVVLGVFVLSSIEPAFSTRFFIPYIPLLILSAAFVMTRKPIYRFALTPLPLLLMVSTVSYSERGDIEWRSAQKIIEDRCQTAESILFFKPSGQSAFTFYKETSNNECDAIILPYQLTKESYLDDYDLDSIDWAQLSHSRNSLVVLTHTDHEIDDIRRNHFERTNNEWNCNTVFANLSVSVYDCNQLDIKNTPTTNLNF